MTKKYKTSLISDCRHHALLLTALLWAAHGCDQGHDAGKEGHGHGHGSEQGHAGHSEEKGPEPVALTLWTATHELFVEFDPLVAGKSSGYHAHVSRIADNRAATSGRFAVRFEQGEKVVGEVVAEKVARKGIFIPRGRTPKQAGTYRLVFTYTAGKEQARWVAGDVKLGSKPAKLTKQAEGGITFLKEQQWGIAFATRLPVKKRLARELALPATIAADPGLTHTVTAPSTGAVLWAGESGPSVIGMKVKRGQILGRLAPAAAPEHASTLNLQIQRSLIERDHARKTLARLEALAKDGLVPARRVVDAQAALGGAEAALKAAKLKVGQLRGKSAGQLPLVSPADGTLVELHVTDGHMATAGQVLAHVAVEDRVLVRAAVFSLDLPRLSVIHRARLILPGSDGQHLALGGKSARRLTQRVVVDPDTLTAPIVYQLDNKAGALHIGELAELRLAVGEEQEHLTVPKEAVVEINTRPYLFVMRSGESFDRLKVRIGPSDGVRVAVLSGISATDRVVITGAFDVYAASLAGDVESHRH